MSPLAHLFSLFIKLYRYLLSPLFPGVCRYVPSCSAYTLEAVRVHGAIKGSYLGVKRILRCHPISFLGGGSGHDPVPERDKPTIKKGCAHDHAAHSAKLNNS